MLELSYSGKVNGSLFVEWNNARYNEWTRRAFDPTNRAQPCLYSIRNDTVFFDTYADQTYTYEAQLYALPAYMTVGTAEPLLPDEDRETLVAGALMDQCLRDKDYVGADYWNKIYEGRIQEMWAKDRLNNQESERVVQMPGHYGGLWD